MICLLIKIDQYAGQLASIPVNQNVVIIACACAGGAVVIVAIIIIAVMVTRSVLTYIVLYNNL